MAPIGSVRGPSDVGVVVGGVFSRRDLGPPGEGDIMGFEEGLGHFDGGTHHNGEGPEFELHDGPVFLGERVDGTVGEVAYEVEVANDGPGFWAGRQIELPAAEVAGEKEEG